MLAVIIINSNKQKRLQINFRSLFIIFHVFSSSLWKYIFWFIFISLNFSLILVNLCVRISYHTLRNVALILLCLSVQFSSVAQSCPTLCDPMTRSTPGLPVHHQLLEFTQTHVHQVGDAIQPSYPLLSPSPPAPNPSQHQSLF